MKEFTTDNKELYNNFSTKFRSVLITGGAGFIGNHLIARLLLNTDTKIYNLDKLNYASDTSRIDSILSQITNINQNRYQFLKTDLCNFEDTINAVKSSQPDLIMHLAAESHVDRSIENPNLFLNNNIIGTYNLLESALKYSRNLDNSRKEVFLFHHISTDEVYGSLSMDGKFNETSPYKPNSPYSASKAASDHFVELGIKLFITNHNHKLFK